MGQTLLSTSNRYSHNTIMEIQDNAVSIPDELLESLRRIAGSITKTCPDYKDDAVSIMVIAILALPTKNEDGTKREYPVTYLKRAAVFALMEALFRSRKYLFCSARNKFPSERYDDDTYKYNQKHKYPSPESEWVADILIARIFEDLTDDERALLVMNFWGEVSLRDIGKLIGKSESTMQRRRVRLFAKIRERLDNGQYCEDQAGA